ncbi:MAG: hypothetical protein EOP85_21965, partial [Verrucomicrobiaceae bacterium]
MKRAGWWLLAVALLVGAWLIFKRQPGQNPEKPVVAEVVKAEDQSLPLPELLEPREGTVENPLQSW